MPYRICKSIEIENGHMLSKHPDACRFPHGHSRRVEFLLEADTLDSHEMVCDFKVLKSAMNAYLKTLDHAMCVNTEDPRYSDLKSAYGERVVGFEDLDPTTEILARRIFDVCVEKLAAYAADPATRYPLAQGLRLVSVKVWETSSSWAEYIGPVAIESSVERIPSRSAAQPIRQV
ncbi:MAG: 6-pyruvoyl tetrahydropterin synthase family protein [Candidatus Methylacidiphilales bacterium]|nr:6-carboxytetrahydropterin synthase [Candidatus Methylacidiphilales bacterium]